LIGQFDVDCLAELEAQIASGLGRIELEMKQVTLMNIDVVRFLVNAKREKSAFEGARPTSATGFATNGIAALKNSHANRARMSAWGRGSIRR
jgi:hypothetical protein